MAEDPASQPKSTPSTAPAAEQTEAERATADVPASPGPASPPPSATVPIPDTGYTPAGVPTFEGVREKIETRYGTSLGAAELAEDTPEGKTAATQFDARQKAAEEKLAEIRASMRKQD